MSARAKIEFEYKSARDARMVAELLELDNRAVHKKQVKTVSRGKKVVTRISSDRPNTFLATIDDLIFCERLIRGLICST